MNSVKVLLLLLLISSCAFCGISQRKDDCRPMEQIAGESEIVIIGTMVARYRVETTRFDIMKVDEVIKGCVKGAHIICSYDYHGDYGEFENEIGYRWLICLKQKKKDYAYHRLQLLYAFPDALYTTICGFGGARRRVYTHKEQDMIVADYDEALDYCYYGEELVHLKSVIALKEAVKRIKTFKLKDDFDDLDAIVTFDPPSSYVPYYHRPKEDLYDGISQSIVRRDFAEMARQVVKITRLLGAMRIHKRQKCQNELCDLLMKHGLYSLAASFLRARRKILLEPIENKGYFWYRGEIPYFEQKNKLLDETLFKLGYAAEKLDRLGVAKQYYEYSLHRHEPISFHRMFSLLRMMHLNGGHVGRRENLKQGRDLLDRICYLSPNSKHIHCGTKKLLYLFKDPFDHLEMKHKNSLFLIAIELLRHKGLTNSVAHADLLDLYADLTESELRPDIKKSWFGKTSFCGLSPRRKVAKGLRELLPDRKHYVYRSGDNLFKRISPNLHRP